MRNVSSNGIFKYVMIILLSFITRLTWFKLNCYGKNKISNIIKHDFSYKMKIENSTLFANWTSIHVNHMKNTSRFFLVYMKIEMEFKSDIVCNPN